MRQAAKWAELATIILTHSICWCKREEGEGREKITSEMLIVSVCSLTTIFPWKPGHSLAKMFRKSGCLPAKLCGGIM